MTRHSGPECAVQSPVPQAATGAAEHPAAPVTRDAVHVALTDGALVLTVPLSSLPKLVQDEDGHLTVTGLDSLEFCGRVTSVTHYATNWNRQPSHELEKALAHFQFALHYMTHEPPAGGAS